MKIPLTIVIAILLGTSVLSGQENKGAIISVEPEVHELGIMQPHEIPDGKLSFAVYNTGDEPLIISNVRACCGTRVDDYTKTPIAVGDSGIVQISWRIHPRPHRINRTVTIASNASNRQFFVARIRGEVVLPEE